MPIRVIFAMAFMAAIFPIKAAMALDAVMQKNAIGCPSKSMVGEAESALQDMGSVRASHWAQAKGCRLFEAGDTVGLVTVDYDPPHSTTCVVGRENEKCLWIPAGRTRSR